MTSGYITIANARLLPGKIGPNQFLSPWDVSIAPPAFPNKRMIKLQPLINKPAEVMKDKKKQNKTSKSRHTRERHH